MNRLADETSLYLRQHAANPVDWYPWGEEAFAEARRRDVPVLLSVGYSACHWCHVMERESFEDDETAAEMNAGFVCVKVDREERPDVDAVYMNAVVGLTGHGGWPMTVFLTPAGEPFFGGTYYPPEPRSGMPSLRMVLAAISEAWAQRRDEVVGAAGRVTEALAATAAAARPAGEPTEEVLRDALGPIRRVYDAEWGGFGSAPKFPPPSLIGFLLRLHARTSSALALEMATGTLDGMALGGMYDVLAGGFHRYSVDRRWLVPHFEKMLYDNAQLAVAYLEAFAVTGEPRYRQVAERTIDYLLAEMALPEGGFAAAQDADTDGVEGSTFVWTPAQLREVLGDARGEAAAAYYGVTAAGTFEAGASVLRPSGPAPADLAEIERELLDARRRRPQPARDGKAVAAWNGLTLAALSQGAWRLARPDLLAAAERLAAFLTETMTVDGRLMRVFADGRAHIPGYLDDHAAVAHGLVELSVATGDGRHLAAAETLARGAAERFADGGTGGFLYSARDGERLVAEHRDVDDNPTPAGSSLLAFVLLRLARIGGDAALERQAAGAIGLSLGMAGQAPHAFGTLYSAVDLLLAPPREAAVIGPAADPRTAGLLEAARAGFHPTWVYAFGDGDGDRPGQPALLDGKTLIDGAPAVYLCERFACRAPLTDPEAVREAMRA
ncbi:MAG TPA: thioredoxin domain-containing protein [Thermoleophilia bacterium]|nr:thioredoxin domain-containing protein [Thermoleophilia bacterium]